MIKTKRKSKGQKSHYLIMLILLIQILNHEKNLKKSSQLSSSQEKETIFPLYPSQKRDQFKANLLVSAVKSREIGNEKAFSQKFSCPKKN